MYLGADALKEVVEKAELFPINGLFNFRDFFDEINAYYHRTYGDEFGMRTGWSSLDSLYRVSTILAFLLSLLAIENVKYDFEDDMFESKCVLIPF